MRSLLEKRKGALRSRSFAAGHLSISLAAEAARYALRGGAETVDAASRAFGVEISREPCRAATLGMRAALWLGPDEWLLLGPESEAISIADTLKSSLARLPHSLVDVSHRNTAFELAGPNVANVLNAGCPLDLNLTSFPVGMCTRTILAKVEIVLWRTDRQKFRVELWRSFAAYAWQFLEEASRDADA
jgi:sarcosine oxidase, subunit gamma